MRTAIILLTLLAPPAFAAQTVWKWVDGNGVTHYSDTPVPGAQRVEISGGNRADPQPAFSSGQTQNPSTAQPRDAANYSTFEIWKPGEGETIANTGGRVQVEIRLEPVLQPGHDLYLYLNGRLVEGAAPSAMSYDLQDVPRGAHRLSAVIQNQRGARVQEASVSFFVRQESIANPPVGPALRPPPKPRPGGAANKPTTTQPSYAALNGARPQIDPRTNLPPPPKKKAPVTPPKSGS